MSETLLLISPEGETLSVIRDVLSGVYELLIADTWEEGLTLLHERRRELSAVLVDLELALENGQSFARELMGDDPFSLMPIIGIVRDIAMTQDLDCLDRGVFDIVTKKTPPRLMLRRIRSAVGAVDSISFHELETLLKVLPSNIFLKDAEGRYVFSTQYWHHLKHADEPGWTIRGKTDLEIRKNRENALKAMAADRQVIESGKGTEYIIKEDSDGIIEYLELVKRPVLGEDGKVKGIVALVNDVTEKELLKMELQKRAQVDRLTELLNKVTTEELVGMRLNYGRRDRRRGALIMFDVDNFKQINDCYGHAVGDKVLAGIGRVIRNSFRGMDVAGRVGGDEFMIYAQDVSSPEAALSLAERIRAQITAAIEDCPLTVSAGIALFPEHGSRFEELYRAADAALYRVKKSGKAACRLYDAETT